VKYVQRGLLVLTCLVGVFGFAATAGATGIDCGPGGANCSITASIDGTPVGTGNFSIDPITGAITLTNTITAIFNGGHIYVTDVNGNADPILGFGVSASTGVAGNAFSVTFNLPIALAGLINANSSVSYSLTGTSSAGAQIAPLLGSNVVIAQEVDTSIGGLAPLNKGVDVGNTFFFIGGPQTQNSPVYTDSNSFVGNLAYDLMSVTVAFSLSPNTSVGISGFVQQVVPEPTMVTLLGVGLVLLAVARRRTA
jgi:hypothetical protein